MSEIRSCVIQYLSQIGEEESEVILERPLPVRKQGSKRIPSGSKHRLSPTVDTVRSSPPVTVEQNNSILDGMSGLDDVSKLAAGCVRCSLYGSRKNVVFGVGNPQANLMFVGEAPGADEDRLGEPFVGRAGQLLNKILIAMEMSREEVYIANILKCRPPGNQNPSQSEADMCIPYLHKQIEIIAPKLIVALGLVAATHLLKANPRATLKSLRKQIFTYQETALMVTYHPAALLRNSNLKRPAWEDMQTAMKFLGGEIEWKPSNSGSGLGL